MAIVSDESMKIVLLWNVEMETFMFWLDYLFGRLISYFQMEDNVASFGQER